MSTNPIPNPLVVDTDDRNTPADKIPNLQPKTVYAGDVWEGQPYVLVAEDKILLTADKKVGVILNAKFGTTINGKLSFSTMPDQISIGGGYWRFNPLLLSCIPSTTPTPIPVLVPSTPLLLQGADDVKSATNSLLSQSDAPPTSTQGGI